MLENIQPAEPVVVRDDGMLSFHSIFHTIQGEGPYAGDPAVFIRLAGCNLKCPRCDTEYTSGRQLASVDQIIMQTSHLLQQHKKTRLVVITGGEPTRQEISGLCHDIFQRLGCMIQIESNGVITPGPEVLEMVKHREVCYVVSPKSSRIHPDTAHANAFKYVVHAGIISLDDGMPIMALDHPAGKKGLARPPEGFHGDIYLNPEDEDDSDLNYSNLCAARDACLLHGHRLGIQLHKLIDLP